MPDANHVISTRLDVPETLQGALDPRWLAQALAPMSGGADIAEVRLTELVKAMAAKVRIAVRFANDQER